MALDENNLVNESLEENKKNKVDLKWKFLNEFSKSFLAWKDKTLFINDIMNMKNIEESDLLVRKLQAFQAYSDDLDIKNFDVSKINIFDLRRQVWKEYMKIKNSRLLLTDKILTDYSISWDWFNYLLEKEV